MTDLDTERAAERRGAAPRATRAELGALRVPELRALAASLGVESVSSLRKGSLVNAISDITAEAAGAEAEAPSERDPAPETRSDDSVAVDDQAGGATDDPEGVASEGAEPTELDAEPAAPVDAVPADAAPAEETESAPVADVPVELPVEIEQPTQDSGTEPDAGAPDAGTDQPAEASTSLPTSPEPNPVPAPEPQPFPADEPVGEVPADQVLDAAADIAPATETSEARGETPAPRSAADHVNAGLTGIAEDLEQLQRREVGEAPAQGQHDGTHPVDAAEPEAAQEGGEGQAEVRGRRRGRGRGERQQQGQQANGQQAAQGGAQQQGDRQQTRGAAQPDRAQQADRAQEREQQPEREPQQPERQQQDRAGDDARVEGRGRGRYRDRKRRGQPGDLDEPEITEDDVLIPIAGILDVLDNYAFVRTSGYLAGTNDVYVSLGQVKKYALRRGDAVVGAVKQPRDGDGAGRQKYNAIVRIDSINGLPVAEAESRIEFGQLTPLYPTERLRLETEPGKLTGRIVDLVAPLGKGTRGLVVAPPKAGKTTVLQAVANAVTRNNPEAHLMVVLVDERPEEVTEMQRTVRGEVIASTFDRPAEDHTTVAELAIERAKRLVELGYDVVVLLDSLTRLGRAYNQVVPASGRVLAGGVDPAALYPPKRFFGAARNIENGGSLTILATALVETGSRTDEAILEEFAGTANMELRLSGELADRRIFPAVDIAASGTPREELLMGPDEVEVVGRLRRSLVGLDRAAALERVLGGLAETDSNTEYLVQTNKSLPAGTGARRGE